MKLTVLFTFLVCLHVSAKVNSQGVTLYGRDIPLARVFQVIEKQTGYVVSCQKSLIENAKPVTVYATDMPLPAFLQYALRDQMLRFSIVNQTILITPRRPIEEPGVSNTLPLFIQILGTVRDPNGEALPNANVVIQGNMTGTVTNDQGVFSIDAKLGDVLVISHIGFLTEEVKVETAEPLTITLIYNIFSLDSLTVRVNTGYQVLDKKRATGSFGKPSMSTFKNRTGTMNVLSRLDGLVPGLTVAPGGQDGNGTFTVIRGKSTAFLNSDPLYVVNGILVSNFSSVNPDDIEEITVLKDAAAASIYGARAANGVIVVTTKSGKKNQGLTVEYSGFFNFQGKPNFDYFPVLTSQQYIQVAKETFDPVQYPWNTLYDQVVTPHDQLLYNRYRGLISQEKANRGLDSLASINNRQQIMDLLYRPAFTNNHTVSVSGGNAIYSFYGSIGYTGVQNTTPGDRDNTYKLNLTQEVNLNKNIKISVNTSLINSVAKGKNALQSSPYALPYQLLRDASGKNLSVPYAIGWSDSLRLNYQERSRINLDYVPLDEVAYGYNERNTLFLNVTGNARINIWKGLSFEGTYGYVKSPGTTEYYNGNKMLAQRMDLMSLTIAPDASSTPQYLVPYNKGEAGTFTTSNSDQRNWTVRNQLGYNATPGQGRDYLSLIVGQEAQESFSAESSSTILGYNKQLGTAPMVDYATLNQGVFGTITGYGSYNNDPYYASQSISRVTSWYALASYTLADKYSIDGSWRQDHSNLFGSDISTQNKPIWSFGGKWYLSKESFFKPVTWVDDLSLRLTYGIAGNSPFVGSASNYDILQAVPESTFGNIAGEALRLNQAANKSLSWESSKTINLGIDFSALKNRISVGFDLYRKLTTDLLGPVMLNTFSGFSATTGNVGKYLNEGIELSLRTENIQSKNFNWSSSFVFSYNKNELLEYSDNNDNAATDGTSKLYSNYFVGYPNSPLFAYRYVGLDEMGDPQIQLADKTITKDPYYQTTGADVVYKGTIQPVFNGGFTNTFSYKGISLAVNMIYSLGNVMRRDINTFYTGRLVESRSIFVSSNIHSAFLNRWKKPGDEAFTDIPAYVASQSESYGRRNTNYYIFADRNIISASYMKVRDITLTYELPPAFLKWLKINKMSVFGQATNFMIWKANKFGIDPEFHYLTAGGRLQPVPHSYSLGVNLTF